MVKTFSCFLEYCVWSNFGQLPALWPKSVCQPRTQALFPTLLHSVAQKSLGMRLGCVLLEYCQQISVLQTTYYTGRKSTQRQIMYEMVGINGTNNKLGLEWCGVVKCTFPWQQFIIISPHFLVRIPVFLNYIIINWMYLGDFIHIFHESQTL